MALLVSKNNLNHCFFELFWEATFQKLKNVHTTNQYRICNPGKDKWLQKMDGSVDGYLYRGMFRFLNQEVVIPLVRISLFKSMCQLMKAVR